MNMDLDDQSAEEDYDPRVITCQLNSTTAAGWLPCKSRHSSYIPPRREDRIRRDRRGRRAWEST
jgi:hypothetical protein